MMIRQQIPSAEFKRDPHGNLQVRTYEGAPWRYLNAPGASQQDVEALITETARHIPDALISMTPQGWGARIALGAGGAATNTYGSQETARQFGGGGADAGDVVLSAVGGGAGQALGDLLAVGGPAVESTVARALRRVESAIPPQPALRAGPVTQQPGSISFEGLPQRVRETVGNMATRAETEAAEALARSSPENARAQRFYQLADEFGVTGVRQGQATADIDLISAEQRALRGGSGQRAHEILRGSEEDILRGLHQAGRDIPSPAAVGRVSGDIGEAGQQLQAGIRARRAQLAQARDALYESAEPRLREVRVATDAPEDLVSDMTFALRERGVLGPTQGMPNSNVYPATTQAMNLIRARVPEQVRRAPQAPDTVRVYMGASPAEAEAIRAAGVIEPNRPFSTRRDIARGNGEVLIETDIPISRARIDVGSPDGRAMDVASANEYTGNYGWTLDDYVRSGYALATDTPLPLTQANVQGAIDMSRAGGTLYDWEAVRKGLNKIMNDADGLDADAIGIVMRRFDDWYEAQAIGNPQALRAIQDARRAHRELLDRFTQTDPNDIGGRVLERIYDLEQSGIDVIDGVVGTRPGNIGSALAAVRRIKRIALDTPEARAAFENGTDVPPELGALREAVFYRVMEPVDRLFAAGAESAAERTTRPVALHAERLESNLRQALDGDGSEIMRELFRPEELARMRDFREFTGMIIPPSGSVNFSGTAYEGARMVRGAVARIAESMFGNWGLALSFPLQVLENTYTRVFRTAVAQRALSRRLPVKLSGQARPRTVSTGAALAAENEDDGGRRSLATTP